MTKIFDHLKADIRASIVVFLVAIPLCLGVALASGAPLISGLISGIVGGIIVGYISKSNLGVSGPAAGLTVIVYSGIADLGGFESFLLAVIVCGILQIIFGFLRMGIIALYFPSSVIKGMLSAIGVIIIMKQIPYGVGYLVDSSKELMHSHMEGYETLSIMYHTLNSINYGAIIICLISLIILFLFEKPFIKKHYLLRQIPAPLLVVMLSIILGIAFSNVSALALTKDHLVQIPVADNYQEFLNFFAFPDFSNLFNKEIYIIGAILAIVASVETLLCVEATDKIDPQRHITPTNKELFAQGIGNIVCGFIGGLPVTQVIVRSSANIQSGGKTKLSAILHGVLIFISLLTIVKLLNKIPLSSLAAILFFVGFKLVKSSNISQIYKLGRLQFAPFIITIIAIVATDLLVGISIGLAVAAFFILYENYKLPFFLESGTEACKNYKISLSESVTFLNKANLMRMLNRIPEGSKITIDASRSQFIDHDILEIIHDFEILAPTKNINLTIKGLREEKDISDPLKFVNVNVK